jgi:hypothetical protein
MSRLKELLRAAPLSACNTQQTMLQCCTPVAQQVHRTQQVGILESRHDDWLELERLLACAVATFKIPVHEAAEMRELARNDLANALSAYRVMARQSEGH